MNRAFRRGGALVAVLLACGCHDKEREETETEAPVPVETELARLGTIQGVIAATGLVSAAPGAEQLVTAPQSARIMAMPKAVGDTVRKGELLVSFDAPSLRAEVTAKSAAVAEAHARLDNAQKSEVRIAGLFERGVAASKELEDARKELRSAEAAVMQAEGESAAATQLGERATVRALFDGAVSLRTHNVGDLVEGGGDPMLRVIDPSRLQIEAAVPLADIGRVKLGSAARIRLSRDAPAAAAATVQSVPAALNAATGTAPVRLSLKADAHLPAGLPVQVEIDAEQHAEVVTIPTRALVRDKGKVFAYVVDAEKKARRREVVVGVEGNGEIEIRSGVKAGEPVVVRGQQSLPDGAAVATTP